jgi:SAM-dependent methyltransferase
MKNEERRIARRIGMTDMKQFLEGCYQTQGLQYQRRYPNEQFMVFLGTNYFQIPREKRGRMKFLELGCGIGANLWVVAREGFGAHGIDLSPTAVQLCQEMLETWQVEAELRVADMTDLPYENEEFDVIYDVVSLLHLNWAGHLKAWNEVHRCLNDGGRFFSYHLGENSVSFKCGAPMVDHCTVSNIPAGYPLANNGEMSFLSANEVRKTLGEIGFRQVNIEKVTRTYAEQKQLIEYLSITARK